MLWVLNAVREIPTVPSTINIRLQAPQNEWKTHNYHWGLNIHWVGFRNNNNTTQSILGRQYVIATGLLGFKGHKIDSNGPTLHGHLPVSASSPRWLHHEHTSLSLEYLQGGGWAQQHHTERLELAEYAIATGNLSLKGCQGRPNWVPPTLHVNLPVCFLRAWWEVVGHNVR